MPNLRVYLDPLNMDPVREHLPRCFVSAGNATDPKDAALVIGGVKGQVGDTTKYDQFFQTFGYDQGGGQDDLTRIDEDNPRIACYLANFQRETVDGRRLPYVDITVNSYASDTLADGTTTGLAIVAAGSNMRETMRDGEYNIYAADGTEFTSIELASWDNRPNVASVQQSPYPFEYLLDNLYAGPTTFWYPDEYIIDAKIPIFIDEASATTYINTGVITEGTCFNQPNEISDIGDNDYFIRSWTYRYNKYKSYVDHDNDKHRLDIKAGGNTVVGYIANDEYYNIRLKASGDNTMVWYTSDGGSYTGSAADFNASRQARAYNTFNQYKSYGNGFVKGGWWDTNIYIYKDEADADMALEHPESVLPINPYDVDETPSPQDTGTNVDTEADLTSQTHDASTGLITLYESSAAALNVLGSALYTANSSFLDGLKIYGESPINSLISVYHCPINLDSFITKEPASAFKVGSNTVTTTGANIVKNYGKIVALGSVLVNPIYNDFRDYTNLEYELHLPFSNPIMLDASEIMGKTLTIKATVDPYNLQIRYYIIVNSVVYKFIDASFGKQVAVLGNDGAGKARELRQDIMGITGNAIGIATGLASGNPVLTANNVMQAAGGVYATLETEKREPKKQVVGAFASGCGENDILYPYLSITETLSIAPANLASVYGRPTNLITKLGNLHGFIAAEMPMLEVNCSDAEREELIAAISEGVIL